MKEGTLERLNAKSDKQIEVVAIISSTSIEYQGI